MKPKGQIAFEDLRSADLIIDAIYKGGKSGNLRDDVLSKLLGCGNAGGFRFLGKGPDYKLVVLFTTDNDPDWPDLLDPHTGLFVYYGDNKSPGHAAGSKKGNKLLETIYNRLHAQPAERRLIPPVFVFSRGIEGHDVVFRGLAVPGAEGMGTAEDLVALWRTSGSSRFQNYKAVLSIMDVPVIPRAWINDIQAGNPLSMNCPAGWKSWTEGGVYRTLKSPRTVGYRSEAEQVPSTSVEKEIIKTIHEHFQSRPHDFELCAAEIIQLMDKRFEITEITRKSVDGGRDIIGKYNIGSAGNSIKIDFAVEAKCYAINNSVGVRYTSRLISRLRYRHFGIVITTSYIAAQAYKEIVEDGHPVLVIAARDIARIMLEAGISGAGEMKKWLEGKFPKMH